MSRLCICAAILALPVLQGCYTYAPLDTGTPPIGETVELNISDRGRVELTERLGRGVSSIRARITGTEGEQYLLNVFNVAYVSGEKSVWSGESMRLNQDFVFQTRVRKMDKKRTWLAAGAATVVIVGFMASRGLLTGFGLGSEDGDGGEPPESFTPRFRIQF
jgi:hypothetical protein